MKKIKRFSALFLSLCFVLMSSGTAFAKTIPDEPTLTSEGSSQMSALSVMPRQNNYNGVWHDKGTYIGRSFQVYNTHTGSVGVTFKVESSSRSSYAQMYMVNPLGLVVIYTARVTPDKGDVMFTIPNGVVGNYTVYYDCYAAEGMRVMCWMY